MPDINTLHQIPIISQAVPQLSIQSQVKPMQGNSEDIQGITVQWTLSVLYYKIMHVPIRKKNTNCKLTLPQWVTGQLTKIYHMKDQETAWHALLQVLGIIKDATSIPWAAVCNQATQFRKICRFSGILKVCPT